MENREQLVERILFDIMEIFDCDRKEAEKKLIEIFTFVKG